MKYTAGNGGTVGAGRPWIPMRESYDGQPAALRVMAEEIQAQLDAGVVAPDTGRLTLIGIGASLAAAATTVYAMRVRGLDATRMDAGDLPDGYSPPGRVIGISQSGRSAEVVDVMSRIEPIRSRAVTNYAPSPLQDAVGSCLNLGDLPDSSVSVASFTGTLLAFGMMIDYWLGTTDPERWIGTIEAATASAGNNAEVIDQFAAGLPSVRGIDVVSCAAGLSVAEETALMLREGPRVPSTGMSTRQYLHGPMDSAGNTAHVVIGTEREATLVEQLAERAEQLLFITPAGLGLRPAGATVIEIPFEPDRPIEFAIAAIMLTQKLVLATADSVGVEVDAPAFTRLDTKVANAPLTPTPTTLRNPAAGAGTSGSTSSRTSGSTFARTSGGAGFSSTTSTPGLRSLWGAISIPGDAPATGGGFA